MRGLWIKWLINSLAILIVTYIVKGIEIASPITAIIAAFVLGIINAFLRPFIILITLPINIFTLGVFTPLEKAADFNRRTPVREFFL